MLLDYQIIVQWSHKNQRYEAFSPTLAGVASKFIPDFPKVAYASTPSLAIENAIIQSKKVLLLLKKLSILPPPADVNYVPEDEEESLEMSI